MKFPFREAPVLSAGSFNSSGLQNIEMALLCQAKRMYCHSRIKSAQFLIDPKSKSTDVIILRISIGSDRRSLTLPLSRWRERGRVRVDTRYIPLTFLLSPEGRGD
jgi:hypothetical protein